MLACDELNAAGGALVRDLIRPLERDAAITGRGPFPHVSPEIGQSEFVLAERAERLRNRGPSRVASRLAFKVQNPFCM